MSQALLLSDPVPSVSLHDGRPATTSLEVAKFFGKTHFHVMRSIKDLIEQLSDNFNQSNFGLASYLDEQAKSRPMYIPAAPTKPPCWNSPPKSGRPNSTTTVPSGAYAAG